MEVSEDVLQKKCVNWFRVNYPAIAIHHSPNGGKRDLRTAANLKRLGVLAGFPDIFIIEPRGEFHGLFIELKNGSRGHVTIKQRAFIQYLKEKNYAAFVCYSFGEFQQIVNNYLCN